MKEQLERLHIISSEIKDIIEYSLHVKNIDIPKGFLPIDETCIPLYKDEQDAFSMLKEVMDILEKRDDIEFAKQKIDDFSKKLTDLSFKPEINKNSFKFSVDHNTYEVLIEQKYQIYFYIHSSERSSPYFIGTAFHFSMVIKLLEFFEDRLKASNQLNKHFEEIMEDVKEAGDKFRPEWRELYKKPLVKAKTMDNIYFTQRDVNIMKKELNAMSAGVDISSLKDSVDMDKLFVDLMLHIRTQDMTDLSYGHMPPDKPKISEPEEVVEQYSMFPQNFKNIFLNNEIFNEFAESILKKYTVRNKLNELRAEIDSIRQVLEDSVPIERRSVNKYPLIKDSLISESEVDFLLLLKEMTSDDKTRLIIFLKEQDDAFFKKRNKMFFNAILSGNLLLDDDLIKRVIPLAFADPSFIIEGFEGLGITKEYIETEVMKKVPGLFDEIENKTVPPEIKSKAEHIGEEISDRLFEKTKDKLSELFNKFSDEDLPEQIANLVNPYLIEEILKMDKYNE